MTISASFSRSWRTSASSTTPSSCSPPTTAPRRSSFPDGGVTPFKGQKGEAWEGGYRAPMVVRWPGHIKPGTVKNQLFAALDWVPTLVDIAGGPKGDGLKTQIEAGVSRHRQDHARRLRPARLSRRRVGKVSARLLLLLLWRDAVRGALQELEDVLHHVATRAGRLDLAARFRSTLPWSRTSSAIRSSSRSASTRRRAMSLGGALGGPVTAFQYDWNMLPIGQQLWLGHLLSYEKYPPLQAPETYNLSGIIDAGQEGQCQSRERLAEQCNARTRASTSWAPAATRLH